MNNDWKTHEDTFEEALRRTLLATKKMVTILENDIAQLTKAYYTILKENERLKKK